MNTGMLFNGVEVMVVTVEVMSVVANAGQLPVFK